MEPPNNHNHDEDNKSFQSMSSDDSFAKAKDKLYFLSLETHFFAKQLQKHKETYNKIDSGLAKLLFEAVEMISDFVNEAEVQDCDEKADVFEIIPSIQNEICQAHRYYYCKACNLSVKASSKSFKEHFFGNLHVKRLREASKKTFDAPKKGSSLSVSEMSSNPPNNKKDRKNSLPSIGKSPAVDIGLPKKIREFLSKEDLDGHTSRLLADARMIQNSQKHVKVCNLLTSQLYPKFPQVKCYPFGSTVIGLGMPRGDLDVFVDLGNCYFKKSSKRFMKNSIHKVQETLMPIRNCWRDFEPVTKARTPILRVYCKAEDIDCDLSFSNGLSSCNTALIGYFIDLQPVCKKLAMFIKAWVQNLQLGMNSYIVSLLVIFYLQQQKLLPSVRILQEACENVFIDDWQANFAPLTLKQLEIPMSTDFYKHLVGFFRFYGYDFNYDKHVVSILTGEPVDKSIFDHHQEENLPPVFERFKFYMSHIDLEEADEVEDLFSNHKPLVIQDPFELCHNVSKGIQAPKLAKILNVLRHTHEVLNARFKN